MYKIIILSSCLFGSIYLSSISLYMINKSLLENKKVPNVLILINGFTFALSSSIFLYNIRSLYRIQ